MPENVTSASVADKEKASASKGDGARPRQGSESRMHANFSSAVSSLVVQHRYILQAIISVFVPTMVIITTSVLLYNMNAMLHLHLNTRARILVLVSIGAISCIIGGLGLLKILLTMGKGRAREFGVRLVVGARRSDIRNQLFIEVLFVSVIGGIWGGASGLGIGYVVVLLLYLPYTINPILSLSSMGMPIIVDIICGFYAVRRIMRQDFARALCDD